MQGMNRRQFIQRAAAGAAFAAAGGFSYRDASPLRVGLIGSGWYGKIDLLRLIQVAPVEVVSLCDVDSRMVSGAADVVAARQASRKRPRTYADYREMLAERDLDVVLVGTPDHWHALPTIAALQSGAHVWVQKPISVDIVEGQAMVAAARKYGRTVQVGTQRRSTPHLIEARDRFIREGLLGDVAHVEIYCYWPMRTRARPEPTQPPDHLDYEMWTGPAPMQPFYDLMHPRGWRAFMEYSNGVVGDMAIHMLDMVRWMLELGWPRRVSSTGGILVDPDSISNIPDTQTAVFDFGDLEMVWTHRTWGNPPDPDYPWGATIYGTRGTLKLSVWGYDFIPTGDGNPVHGDVVFEQDRYPEDEDEPGIELFAAPAIRYQMLDFLHAIETGTRPVADIEEGHISTASCILANLALQTGETLEWDPATHTITNHDAANKLLERSYRQPWLHPRPDAI
jgi:predicted dehydrogenase